MPETIADRVDYSTARHEFTGASQQRGAVCSTYPHPQRGPSGEELACEVARFGAPPGAAEVVVIVNSGTHGVEGHAGHGLQMNLLESGRLDSLRARLAVLAVHAVNPFGFAWGRRVDAANIDVNRNFVDYTHLPVNEHYARLNHLVNPSDPELDLDDMGFAAELTQFANDVGMQAAMRTLTGGQYEFPQGVQYGGAQPSWSRQTCESIWDEHLAGADAAVLLDIHTGLGPEGYLSIFQTADEHEPAAKLGQKLFADRLLRADRDEDDPVDIGLMGPGLDAWAARRTGAQHHLDTSAFVLEFGTLDPISTFIAFRTDNWLHNHGDPHSERGQQLSEKMRDQFFLRDESWRSKVGEQGTHAIHSVLDQFS